MGCGASKEEGGNGPSGWPKDIPVDRDEFENWVREQSVGHLWIAKPRNPADCVAICDWMAKRPEKERGQVRPAGTKWSWSPIVFARDTPNPNEKDVMIDMTAYDTVFSIDKEKMEVTCAPGIKILQLLEKLDEQGMTLSAYTGGGAMSIGGCIAVGAKGVLAQCTDDSKNAPGTIYGSMANLVMEFSAVVSEDGGKTYVEKTFKRGDPEADALITAVGRTLMTRVTLKAMPQFNARAKCTFDIPASAIFAPPNDDGSVPEHSYTDLVDKTGRVSAIYIPFSDVSWTRTFEYCPEQPDGSKPTDHPYNYPYQDSAQAWQTSVIEGMLGQPHETFLERMAGWVEKPFTDGAPGPLSDAAESLAEWEQQIKEDTGLAAAQEKLTLYYEKMQAASLPKLNKAYECEDFWGKSYCALLYVNADLKIESHGITVVCRRKDMQRNINITWTIFNELMAEYQDRGEYPMNGQMEWRACSLDNGKYVGVDGSTPYLTSGTVDQATIDRTGWDVLFVIECIYLPHSRGINKFVTDLISRYNARPELSGDEARIMPEWSKPFATTANGEDWTNEATMADIRGKFANWNAAVAAQEKYDPAGLFRTPFNDWMFKKV